MEKYFRTQNGDRVNVVEHTLEQIEKWPNLKMYIGTDSQDEGAFTKYVTTIVYRYGSRGAHIVYLKDEIPRVKDIFTRLYNEGVKTIEIATMVTDEIPVSFEALEFDYADVKKTQSSKVVSSLKGWTKGINMNCSFKSGEQLATKASDHILRHPILYK